MNLLGLLLVGADSLFKRLVGRARFL